MFHHYKTDFYSLKQIVNNEVKLKDIIHPLPLFNDYLKRGYYFLGLKNEMDIPLGQIIVQTLETDIPQFANLNNGTSRKFKLLLSIIAESVPFKPKICKI